MTITEQNYKIVKAQILAIRNQLKREMINNHDGIKSLQNRQKQIENEWKSFSKEMEQIGEFELEAEYKFLLENERHCDICQVPYVPIQGRNTKKICTACFTSNA